jgi:hypothetical protein
MGYIKINIFLPVYFKETSVTCVTSVTYLIINAYFFRLV